MGKSDQPCPKCGHNKWKTKIKDKAWECRGCKSVRILKEEPGESNS